MRPLAVGRASLQCGMGAESPLWGIPVAEIARVCQVHPDTARRWKRQGTAPRAALSLLKTLFERYLGDTSEPWAGWRLSHGELVSPQGDRFTPGMVLAGKYYREMVHDARVVARQATDACGSGPSKCEAVDVSSLVSVP